MKYQVGDVVWSRTLGKVCVVEVVDRPGLYKVIYVRPRRIDGAEKLFVPTEKAVRADDLLDWITPCHICGRSVAVQRGLVTEHRAEGQDDLCYGSFLPLR
jgi:hypothetical protein